MKMMIKTTLVGLTCLCFSFPLFSQRTLKWAIRTGAIAEDWSTAITLDQSRNVLHVGRFAGTVDFDPGNGTTNFTATNFDGFVRKLNPNGGLVWVKRFQSSNYCYVRAVATDAGNNVYLAGDFSGTLDIDPGPNTISVTSAAFDGFLVKLDSTGNYLWHKVYTASGDDAAYSVAVKPNGNVVVCGQYSGTINFGGGNVNGSGGKDIFIGEYNPAGTLSWMRTIGGTSDDVAFAVHAAASGDIYATGSFRGTVDFDPGGGTVNLTSNTAAFDDIFVLKLNSTGNYTWARRAGGTEHDAGLSITTDAAGNVIFGGYFSTTTDFDPSGNTANLVSQGGNDMFIAKWTSAGAYTWAKGIGGVTTDKVHQVITDPSGNVLATGLFQGTPDFDPGPGTVTYTAQGTQDGFILQLTSAGNYSWSEIISGGESDAGYGIALDQYRAVHATGLFRSVVNFDPSGGVFNLSSAGSFDMYVERLLQCQHSNQTLTLNLCQGDSVFAAGQWRKVSGSYNDQFISSRGCDSLRTLVVNVVPNYAIVMNPQVCTGQSYTLPDGNVVSNPGTYLVSYISVHGCDSNYTVNLSVTNNFNINQQITICQGDSLFAGGTWRHTAGTFNDQLTSTGGCDSNVTTVLSVAPVYSTTLNDVICQGTSYTLPNGQSVSNAGAYNVTVPTSQGCDSSFVINLNLAAVTTIVNQPNSQVLNPGLTAAFSVSAIATNVVYQWQKNGVDLVNGGNILGANATTLQVSSITGNDQATYRCRVSGVCGVEFSNDATLTVIGAGIEDNPLLEVRVYPNPTNGPVMIVSEKPLSLVLMSVDGKVTWMGETIQAQTQVDFSHLPPGYYVLQLSDGEKIKNHPVILTGND